MAGRGRRGLGCSRRHRVSRCGHDGRLPACNAQPVESAGGAGAGRGTDVNSAVLAPRKSPEEIERRIRELGDWFHNMNLGGVLTAPDHFLGDYPNTKWREFADSIPSDLTGKNVLDIGCNAGF